MPYERLTTGDGPAPRPSRLSDTLDRVLAGLGAPPASSLEVVERAWEDLVGPAAADALRPLVIRDGSLVVTAADPVWVGQAPLLGTGVVTALVARAAGR